MECPCVNDDTKFGRLLRKILLVLQSELGLFIILVIYSVVGAAIFEAIEKPRQELAIKRVRHERAELFDLLYQMAHWDNYTKHEWIGNVSAMVIRFENTAREDIYASTLKEDGDEPASWDFWGALIFCGTVYTTIGYGYLAPSTPMGKLVCTFYACIGIPLCLVVLARIGSLLAIILRLLWRKPLSRKISKIKHRFLDKIKDKFLCRKPPDNDETLDEPNVEVVKQSTNSSGTTNVTNSEAGTSDKPENGTDAVTNSDKQEQFNEQQEQLDDEARDIVESPKKRKIQIAEVSSHTTSNGPSPGVQKDTMIERPIKRRPYRSFRDIIKAHAVELQTYPDPPPYQRQLSDISSGSQLDKDTESGKSHQSIADIVHAHHEFSMRELENVQPSITGALLIVILYIILGGAMYQIWEEWDFLNSCYFIFQSLTTIGFGDMVPAHPKYFITTFLYVFCGLSLMSMLVNIIVVHTNKKINKVVDKRLDSRGSRSHSEASVVDASRIHVTKLPSVE